MVNESARSTGPLSRLVRRALEPRVAQLRRDVRAVLGDLRGERPRPWLARDGSRYVGAPTGGLATRELEVARFTRETADAVSLVLRDPSGAELPAMRPGQFFTLLVELDGETLRRAYSLSDDCRDRGQARVTIKRVAGGRVSNALNDLDEARAAGLRLRVLGPSGEFGWAPEPERAAPRKLVLLAGGGGITPMMALIHTLLAAEDRCEIALIYANRERADVIFADELAGLEAQHAPRLQIIWLLERAPEGWSGLVGRGDADTLAAALERVELAGDPAAQYMLCGPAPMIEGARELLASRGVEAARVHVESFVAPHLRASAAAKLRGPQALTLVQGEREIGLVVQPGQTVLEAGLAAGLDLPYSCAMGGCGACTATVERGELIMREPNCLGERERAAGQILACVASPITACRVRVEER